MAHRIQIRRDTAANWTAANPILASGEIAYETDTQKLKFGNGVTAWNALAYYVSPSAAHTHTAAEITDFAGTVRALVLTGLSFASGAAITAADSVLSAFGKLQKQIINALEALNSHLSDTGNPHGVTVAQLGFDRIENTSDADKPVSEAAQAAFDNVYAALGDKTNFGHGHVINDVAGLQSALDAKKSNSITTNKLLGRGTAGTGAIEEITLGTNLSLTGTTLNAIGGGVGGTGTTGYLAKFTGSNALGNSRISDNGDTVNIAGKTKTTVQNAADVGYLIQLISGQTADAMCVLPNGSTTPVFRLTKDGDVYLNYYAGIVRSGSNGNSPLRLVNEFGGRGWQIQNSWANESGYSGFDFLDNGGAFQGFLGSQNASSNVVLAATKTAGILQFQTNTETVGQFDTNNTAGNTRFLLYDNAAGTLKRVTIGAADSGGAGFKALRIAN